MKEYQQLQIDLYKSIKQANTYIHFNYVSNYTYDYIITYY